MTKTVSITIIADTEVVARAVAQRIVNSMDNVVAWSNTNHAGLVSSISARTQDVTVVATKSQYTEVNNVLTKVV
jgi:hypothetical protein